MRIFNPMAVLAELEDGEHTADVGETIQLLGLAGFVPEEHRDEKWVRIFAHHRTRERVWIYTRYNFIPPQQGQAIALIIRNYWP